MADPAQTNELSSWFVRRVVGGGEAKPQQEAAQKQQKGGRGRHKEATQPAEPPKKPSLPAAAAAAVAAVVHPERKPKADGAEAGDPKKQPQAQQQPQQQQHKQQGTKPPSGSDSDSDADHSTRRAGRRRRSQDEVRSGDDEQHKQQHKEQPQRAADQEQQAAAKEEEEVDDRPRVLAYSDSDSDVESHFKRFERDVTQHLLPPSEEEAAAQAAAAEAAAAAAKAAEEAAAAAARRSPVRRLGGAAAGVAGAAARHLTPGLAVRAGGLLALQRVHLGAARAASAVSVAAPRVGAAASRAGVPLGTALPRVLQAAGRELGQFGQAAVALAVGRLLLAALRQHQHRRRQRRTQTQGAAAAPEQVSVTVGQPVATPRGRLLRRKSSVNLAALVGCGDLSASIRLRNPQTAAEWAAVYAAEMREMRRMLQECDVELPPERFDSSNAELFRFAKACGLATAKTPEARAAAVEAGLSRVVHTVDWAARHRFMTDRELRRWDRLVAWKAHDSNGRPILLARVGRAMQLVKPERYEEFTNALVSLVHKGITTQFSNAPGGAEQMVVVLDCRGGSSVGMTRHMGLLKKFAVTVTQHFPDRLFRLHLLELPLLLRWALHAVTPLLHPATRSKVVTSSINDPQLPVTVAFLSKRRSSGGKSLKRNLSNASFPSSGDSTPALLSPQPSQLGVAAVAAASAAVAAGAAASQHAAAAGLPLGPHQQQQQRGQEQKDEDVPNTPPPTLKAPQSPHELSHQRVVRRLSQERRSSQERVALHARQHLAPSQAQQQDQGEQASEGKPQHSPHSVRHVALHARANLHSHAHSHLPGSPPRHPRQAAASGAAAGAPQEAPPSPFAGRAQERALSWGPFDAAAALPAAAGSQAQPAAAAAAAGPAGGKAAAASAAAGPTSHAVPWSPGMQSPSGDLSRDSSFGEELVPAARAIAAAEAVREVDGAARAARGAAGAASSALATHRPPPLQHVGSCSSDTLTLTPTPLPTTGANRQQQQGGAEGSASSSTGSGAGSMWGMLAALLPALRSPGGSAVIATAAEAAGEPELRRRRLLAHRIPSFTSSREPSPVTPYSTRRRDGLGDLPEQPRRRTPGRGVTPRKSSLRRTVSADSEDGSRQPLGSHPLRRQSSVSWAEELESVKEIQPHPEHASPDGPARWLLQAGLESPLRQRLTAAAAAAGQQPPSMVLGVCLLVLMMVAMAERLLLGQLA